MEDTDILCLITREGRTVKVTREIFEVAKVLRSERGISLREALWQAALEMEDVELSERRIDQN